MTGRALFVRTCGFMARTSPECDRAAGRTTIVLAIETRGGAMREGANQAVAARSVALWLAASLPALTELWTLRPRSVPLWFD